MARSALLAAFLLLAGSTQAADTLCLIHPSPARSTPFPSIEAHEIAALYYWPESMTIFGRTRRLIVPDDQWLGARCYLRRPAQDRYATPNGVCHITPREGVTWYMPDIPIQYLSDASVTDRGVLIINGVEDRIVAKAELWLEVSCTLTQPELPDGP